MHKQVDVSLQRTRGLEWRQPLFFLYTFVVLYILWRWNIARSGQWIDIPEDPHTFVDPKYRPIVDYLAQLAKQQFPDMNVANNALFVNNLNQAVIDALMEADGEPRLEIDIPEFYGDANGIYQFRTTVREEKLKEFGLMDLFE